MKKKLGAEFGGRQCGQLAPNPRQFLLAPPKRLSDVFAGRHLEGAGGYALSIANNIGTDTSYFH
jgi:hypothetical protein